jgi:hypothetical protein
MVKAAPGETSDPAPAARAGKAGANRIIEVKSSKFSLLMILSRSRISVHNQ